MSQLMISVSNGDRILSVSPQLQDRGLRREKMKLRISASARIPLRSRFDYFSPGRTILDRLRGPKICTFPVIQRFTCARSQPSPWAASFRIIVVSSVTITMAGRGIYV